jgi:hypothetical protein
MGKYITIQTVPFRPFGPHRACSADEQDIIYTCMFRRSAPRHCSVVTRLDA